MTGRPLTAHHHVLAALDHESRSAAVLVAIALAVGLQIIDQDGVASGNGNPGIRVTTMGVPSGIAHPQRRKIIDLHVGGTSLGGANTIVRAAWTFVVVVLGYAGIVAESGLRLHCMLENIPQYGIWHIAAVAASGRCEFWH